MPQAPRPDAPPTHTPDDAPAPEAPAAPDAATPDASAPDEAQTQPAGANADSETQADPNADPGDPTLVIDPDQIDGVELSTAEQEPEVKGVIEETLEQNVPDTGVDSLDTAVGGLAQAVGKLSDGFVDLLPQLAIGAVVLMVTAVLVRAVERIARKIMARTRVRSSLRDLVRMGIRLGVWFLGLMVAAGIVFPGFGFAELVATAGLASIAVGFAFQNIFENFFAGILILWRFPFENGDYIAVEDITGQVEDVEVRMTRIRQTDGDLVLVPNATIFNSNVTVFTNRPSRRIEVRVGVAYGEDVATARDVIGKAVNRCQTVLEQPKPEVLALAFGASSIDFDVLWYTGNTPIEERRSRAEVVTAIKKALDDAGIEIPYPYRTLTFSKNEPDIIRAVAGRTNPNNNDNDNSTTSNNN